jgi:hypothetical protein
VVRWSPAVWRENPVYLIFAFIFRNDKKAKNKLIEKTKVVNDMVYFDDDARLAAVKDLDITKRWSQLSLESRRDAVERWHKLTPLWYSEHHDDAETADGIQYSMDVLRLAFNHLRRKSHQS